MQMITYDVTVLNEYVKKPETNLGSQLVIVVLALKTVLLSLFKGIYFYNISIDESP